MLQESQYKFKVVYREGKRFKIESRFNYGYEYILTDDDIGFAQIVAYEPFTDFQYRMMFELLCDKLNQVNEENNGRMDD